MQHHKKEIESLNQSIIDYQEVATYSAVQAAEEKRKEAEPALTNIMQPNAFERHLNNFLEDERAAFNSGDRDEPLCDCSRPSCPLKQAKLPPQIKDDLREGIRTYQREHVGNASGLVEARNAFIKKCADVKTVLRTALGRIKQEEPEEEAAGVVEA